MTLVTEEEEVKNQENKELYKRGNEKGKKSNNVHYAGQQY